MFRNEGLREDCPAGRPKICSPRARADIVPEIQELRVRARPRLVGETPHGAELRDEIAGLKRLVEAYRNREVEPPAT